MVKKELPKRVFKKGKKPLGKTSGKIREKKKEIQGFEAKIHVSKIKFPKISLSIPELHFPITFFSYSWVQAFWMGIILVGSAFLLWQIMVFAQIYPKASQQTKERKLLTTKLSTWQNLSSKYPLYRDAHMKVAILAYRLGERELLKAELEKVLTIDPNFSLGRKLGSLE